MILEVQSVFVEQTWVRVKVRDEGKMQVVIASVKRR